MCALRFSRILGSKEFLPEPDLVRPAPDPVPDEIPSTTAEDVSDSASTPAPFSEDVFKTFECGPDEFLETSENLSALSDPRSEESSAPSAEPEEEKKEPATADHPPVAEPVLFEETPPSEPFDEEAFRNIKGIDNIMEESGLFADYLRETKFYDVCLRVSEMLNVLRTSSVPDLAWQDVKDFVTALDGVVTEELGAFWLEALNIDFDEVDRAAEKHNINAGIICRELARVLKYTAAEQLDLAAATLIYNVGSLKGFPPDSVGTNEEKNSIDRSVNVARKIGAPSDVLRAISECHERVNGSGTPLHLQGSQISPKGQLLGLAISFEELFQQQRREFQKTGAPFEPVMEMLRINRDQFSPNVLKGLLLAGGFYQVGAIVELNSGALARVISQNRGAPLRPLVEVVLDRKGNHPVRRQIIDLRENPSLSIVKTVTRGK